MKCFIAFNMTVMIFGLLCALLKTTAWTGGSATLAMLAALVLGTIAAGAAYTALAKRPRE